jgi:hypothetical protein
MSARVFHYIAIAAITAAAFANAGCEVVEKAEKTVIDLGTTVYPADKKMGWYQTKQQKPMYLMTARLSIPQANAEKVKEIPIQKFERVTWSGKPQPAPEMVVNSSSGIAALPGQCNGTITIDPEKSKDNAVTLSMRYWWQTTDHEKGRLIEDVEIPVGTPSTINFETGAVLEVQWKKVG